MVTTSLELGKLNTIIGQQLDQNKLEKLIDRIGLAFVGFERYTYYKCEFCDKIFMVNKQHLDPIINQNCEDCGNRIVIFKTDEYRSPSISLTSSVSCPYIF